MEVLLKMGGVRTVVGLDNGVNNVRERNEGGCSGVVLRVLK